MRNFFARRTSWNLSANRYTEALEAHRQAGREVLDLTVSNPTTIGLHYREQDLLKSLAHREALTYAPQAQGLRTAREAVSVYYAARGVQLSPDDLILTTSTSEAYSFLFRLLCDPGDTVLVPTPSYPLFDFLADLQDVKLEAYELVYDHGWQIDFPSLQKARQSAQAAGSQCRAVLVVHPNNPTGSFVKAKEADELNSMCAATQMAIIADEVFLDYSLTTGLPLTFSANQEVLTFTLSGLSKISALPQMKVAWIAASGPMPLKVQAMNRLEVIADTYLSVNAPLQWALPVMLEERHGVQQQLLRRVSENLALLDLQLGEQKLCRRLEVEGGWYVIVRVPITGSDEDLAISLLQTMGVLVQPGHFYDFASDGYLVISLITPTDEFAEGMRRLLALVGQIHS